MHKAKKQAIEGIIFDFYGVISIRTMDAFFAQHIPRYHQRESEFDELTRQRDLGFLSVDDYLARISAETGLPPQECLAHMHHERTINYALLQQIRSEYKPYYKIGMLSNAAGDLRTYINPALVTELFDDMIISADVGIVKPDPRIFTLACEHLGTQPARTVMVDDLAANCEGARQAGLKTVHYRTLGQAIEELQEILYA